MPETVVSNAIYANSPSVLEEQYVVHVRNFIFWLHKTLRDADFEFEISL